MKDSFVFYKSFYDAIKQIPEEYQLELYNAILQYSLEGIEPSDLSNIANAMFTLIKPNIDSSQSRYESSVENGKKGGAPIGNQNARKQPKNNLETTQKQPKNNLNDNVNDNDNDNVNVIKEKNIKKRKVFQKPTIEEIKQYCTDRNNNVDAEQFYDFYESKGWKVGKEPMKDWKACIRTWEKNTKSVQRNEKNKEKNIKNCESREYEDYDEFYDNDFF